MTNIQRVTVLGGGVLGSQIAFQTAYSGFEVTVYDINDEALGHAAENFDRLVPTYEAQVEGATAEKVEAVRAGLRLTSDLGEAVAQADLVIEAIPEVLDLKRETWARVGQLAPASTIFATNSSTLLPSDMAASTGRAERFLALHFANQVWKFNTAEVMPTPSTDPAITDTVKAFASEIGMVPIVLHKEKAGYVLNSLLVPLLNAGLGLVAGGYADVQDVDKTWRIATGAPLGPMQIYDVIGLRTPYNILRASGPQGEKLASWLKENYIDKGKLGLASGEGFYTYS